MWRSTYRFIILLPILILMIYIPISQVYGAIRNTAPEGGGEGNQTTYVESLNVPPELFDQALFDLVESLDRAIDIADEIDPELANRLREKREDLLEKALMFDVEGVLDVSRDIDELINELLREALSNGDREVVSQVIDLYQDYQFSTTQLEDLDSIDIDVSDIVSPPRDISPPKEAEDRGFTPPSPEDIYAPMVGTGILSIIGYTTLIGFTVIALYLAYQKREYLAMLMRGLRRRTLLTRSVDRYRDFYHFFLEKAARMGYVRMHFEAPLEHASRIGDDRLRSLGLYIGRRFEDKRYGSKKIPMEEEKEIWRRIEEI